MVRLGDNRLEDRYADSDIDVEDLVEGMHVTRSRGGSQQVRAGTWITLGPFLRTVDGKLDVGALVLVGAAFDWVALGPVHHLARPDPVDSLWVRGSPTVPRPLVVLRRRQPLPLRLRRLRRRLRASW